MTKATYAVPATQDEEDALVKALATRTLQKLDTAKALFQGAGYKAFREELDQLIAMKLPTSTATAMNANNLVSFLDTMSKGVERDHAAADAVVNPPEAAPAAPSVPAV